MERVNNDRFLQVARREPHTAEISARFTNPVTRVYNPTVRRAFRYLRFHIVVQNWTEELKRLVPTE